MNKVRIVSLLAAIILAIPALGQLKAPTPERSGSAHNPIPRLTSKLSGSQGTGAATNVHCGLQDKKGILWFGTTGEGVFRFDGKWFTNYTVKEGLSSNIVWSVLEDKAGNIWFGTDDGICCYDGKAIRSVPIWTGNTNFLNGLGGSTNSAAKNEVWSMMLDKTGTVWFGTTNGVYTYNGNTFTPFPASGVSNPGGLRLKRIQCMLQDKAGNIWFGSGLGEKEGLCRFDGKSLTNFKPNGDDWIRSIWEDKKGNLWLACRHSGLSRYDGKTFTAVGEGESFATSGTGSLTGDKAGNIWFASLGAREDGGAWRFNGKTFTNLTTKEGLTNNSVFSILADKSGNVWFGTRNLGLCRYDGKSITTFSE